MPDVIDISKVSKDQIIETNLGAIHVFEVKEDYFIGGVLACGKVCKFFKDGTIVIQPENRKEDKHVHHKKGTAANAGRAPGKRGQHQHICKS